VAGAVASSISSAPEGSSWPSGSPPGSTLRARPNRRASAPCSGTAAGGRTSAGAGSTAGCSRAGRRLPRQPAPGPVPQAAPGLVRQNPHCGPSPEPSRAGRAMMPRFPSTDGRTPEAGALRRQGRRFHERGDSEVATPAAVGDLAELGLRFLAIVAIPVRCGDHSERFPGARMSGNGNQGLIGGDNQAEDRLAPVVLAEKTLLASKRQLLELRTARE
jgi:hypothetical protein